MSNDLVKKLRSPAIVFYEYSADDGAVFTEAANCINELWARKEVLEKALREIEYLDRPQVREVFRAVKTYVRSPALRWRGKMTDDLVKRLRADELPGDRQRHIEARIELFGILNEAAGRIEALEAALRRLVSWGAACPTEREDRLSHAAEGAKAFHAARAALGEDVHD